MPPTAPAYASAVLPTPAPRRLLVLASGGGSNAQRLLDHFAAPASPAHVVGLLSNNPAAGALARAERAGVATEVFSREDWRSGTVQRLITERFRPDLIILAGFLWLVPAALVAAYRGRILNIHPALLPKFGGKGMHGHHVHAAVLAAGERESGMTIHAVNEQYDDGAPLFQARCPVYATDTPQTLADRVLTLEHRYLPVVVEAVVRGVNPARLARAVFGEAVPPDEILSS